MADQRYCMLVNPAAGGGQVGRRLDTLLAAMETAAIEFDCHISNSTGDCREFARQAREGGCEHFIAVGGDGTASEVINGAFSAPAADQAVTLAVVPWGTGNDWAAYYGLPSGVTEFVELLRAGSRVRQDLGRIRFTQEGAEVEHYFLNCTGTGIDSYLLGKMGSAGGSRLRYLRYVLQSVRNYHATPLKLRLDDEIIFCPALMLEVCLGQYAGAGMRLAPEADTGDGAFEVVLVEDPGRWGLITSLPYLYNGRINDHPSVRHIPCRTVSIDGDKRQRFHCDGELVGELPAKLEIVPRALQVVAPH